jgi:hypothetical protein
MPNVIASGTTVLNGTIKRNNFLIGVNTSLQYGPTSATTFWNGVVPPTSGYTVYAQKSVNGPSIRTAANDAELITIAKQYGGTNITTIYDALNYFNGQSNNLVTNIDYPNIVTSGLTILLDAAYVPSYPTTGNTIYDLSGTYNHTLTVAPFTILTGVKCFDQNSNTSNIEVIGTGPTLPTSGYTYVTWARIKTSSVTYRTLFRTAPNDHPILVEINTDNLGFYDNDTSSFRDSGYDVTPIEDVWAQYSVVGDSSSSTFYINGAQVGSSVAFGAGGNTHDYWGLTGQPFGYLANLYLYNRKLSITEITQNYNALKSRFGL